MKDQARKNGLNSGNNQILFIFIIYVNFMIATTYWPFLLIPLFLIMKIVEIRSTKNAGSRRSKGICYLGLGVIVLLGIIQPNDIGVSIYVATMCFIEFFDMVFDKREPLSGQN